MLFFDSNAFRVTAIIFILLTILLTLLKPPMFFDPIGRLKAFDLNYTDETTPVPFAVFIYTILVLLYLVMIFIEIKIKP